MKRVFFVLIMIGILSGILISSCSKNQPGISGEKVREYANVLYNRELYHQAIREYQRYLDLYSMDDQQRANINFIIGDVYFDRLHEYENAMAHYLKVKHVFPESNLVDNVNKKIVECLERLQRSADAKQALDEATSLDAGSTRESRPGTVVARIGDRDITSGDLEYHIGQLPDYLQSQMKEPDAKVEFLRQFIATELFYDAARRKGVEKDKDVIEGTFQAKKGLMVQKYLQDEITPKINITQEDVDLYYKANKEKYVEKDDKGNVKRQKPFNEVQREVAEDLMRERQQKAYSELLQRMMTAEKVDVYTDRIQ